MEVCWAEAISESVGTGGPRYLIEARKTQSIDSALSRIIELPFHVDFQIEALACAPTPTVGVCAEIGVARSRGLPRTALRHHQGEKVKNRAYEGASQQTVSFHP